jgi:hypothetical protein
MIYTVTSFLFMLTAADAVTSYTTTNGNRKVKVWEVPVTGTASDLSNTKCIEYTEGAPTDWTKGCFTTIYNINNNTIGCATDFDDMDCNSCNRCESTDTPPISGFEVECNNQLPTKNIQSRCEPLFDRNIQDFLTNSEFDVDFVFAEEAVPAPTPTGGGGSSATSTFSLAMVAVAAMFGLSL